MDVATTENLEEPNAWIKSAIMLTIVWSDENGDTIVPVTVHAITRQQIKFRLKSGRFAK